jgi:hypothetical protein
MHSDRNPYAPPQAHVADAAPAPRGKPRTVVWATVALCVSYGLMLAHAAIFFQNRSISWPPEPTEIVRTLSFLFYVALIYFVSGGRYWARLIYAVLLAVRTVTVIWSASARWQYSEGLMVIEAISLVCGYMAMYWLFTEPGRRWFRGY